MREFKPPPGVAKSGNAPRDWIDSFRISGALSRSRFGFLHLLNVRLRTLLVLRKFSAELAYHL
jgi:hypothetical protein